MDLLRKEGKVSRVLARLPLSCSDAYGEREREKGQLPCYPEPFQATRLVPQPGNKVTESINSAGGGTSSRGGEGVGAGLELRVQRYGLRASAVVRARSALEFVTNSNCTR